MKQEPMPHNILDELKQEYINDEETTSSSEAHSLEDDLSNEQVIEFNNIEKKKNGLSFTLLDRVGQKYHELANGLTRKQLARIAIGACIVTIIAVLIQTYVVAIRFGFIN